MHRFYTGHTALGIVQLVTLGGCGIWALIDFIMLCFNKFKNADGLPLREYNKTLSMVFFYVWLSLFVLNIVLGVSEIVETLASSVSGGI